MSLVRFKGPSGERLRSRVPCRRVPGDTVPADTRAGWPYRARPGTRGSPALVRP
jgi:hypothetical protein